MNYTKTDLVHGYTNRILAVDLETRTIETKPLDPRMRDYFIGGRGLGLYLLYRRLTPTTGPYDPENPLIFSPGPLGGVPQFPGTSKCMAISLSPLTGIPGLSNFGGHFGAFIKYAGFDALEVVGKSQSEVMIIIDSFAGRIEIADAAPCDCVFDLERSIVERFVAQGYNKKNIVFVTTGIGAANTTFGCINSHYYDPTKISDGDKGRFRVKQAGRTGLGTIQHDKNIKAIVVIAEYPHGDNPYGAADWDRVKKAGAKLAHVVKDSDPKQLQLNRRGSAGLITFMNQDAYRSLPVRNYQSGADINAERISGNFYAEKLFDHRGRDGCFPGCTLQCTKGGWTRLDGGKGEKVWVDGPEYETAAGFGSNLGIWNPEFIMEANWHCDNYGIDTITTSVIVAFIMECFQRGYLTSEDTGGIEITWGNEAAVLQLIHQLAAGGTEFSVQVGRGMTALMEWVAGRYAQRNGGGRIGEDLERFAMHAKGLPFSLYRTHRSLSMQASYAAANDAGAHHAAAWLIKLDLLGAFPTFSDKAKALVDFPRVRLGNDNLGICKLPWVDVFNPDSEKRTGEDRHINAASQELYADFYNGMLGTNLTWQQIFAQTDRDINLQRVMNAMKYGRDTNRHDLIPERAIGPTDEALYEDERDYNDAEVCRILEKSGDEVARMPTAAKRQILMEYRRDQLKSLIAAYYEERGWSSIGVPEVDTLKSLGLWEFLREDTKGMIEDFNR